MTRFEMNIGDHRYLIHATYYYRGTNFPINSASLEPNDPEEFEYEILDLDGNEVDMEVGPWLEARIFEEFKRLEFFEEFKRLRR